MGVGAVGARAARQLQFLGPLDDLVVADADPARARAVADSLGTPARVGTAEEAGDGDVVVLAHPGSHADAASAALAGGAQVVSTTDDLVAVQQLLALDAAASDRGRTVVVGAGFSPGLSCVLAALAARSFERVDEVHVAKVGTGGPACEHQQLQAVTKDALDWRDGAWETRRGGSGRELFWFPDPLRGVDCYCAALPEPTLLLGAFPRASRITARAAGGRKALLLARLPKLRREDAEGTLGAVRVEVRGAQGTALDDRVLGAVDRPVVAAGAVAAMAARWALDGRLARAGASGLASLVEPGPFLAALADRGVKVAVFEGGSHGAPAEAAAGRP